MLSNAIKTADGKYDWFKIAVLVLLSANWLFIFRAGNVADGARQAALDGKKLSSIAGSYASDAYEAANEARDYASEASDYASNCPGN